MAWRPVVTPEPEFVQVTPSAETNLAPTPDATNLPAPYPTDERSFEVPELIADQFTVLVDLNIVPLLPTARYTPFPHATLWR
jgi:hypothetical protein